MKKFRVAGRRKTRACQFNLLDRNEFTVFFLKIGKLDCGKQLKRAPEAAVEPLRSLRNAPNNTVITCKKNDDPVGLGQIVAFQDKAFGFV